MPSSPQLSENGSMGRRTSLDLEAIRLTITIKKATQFPDQSHRLILSTKIQVLGDT